MVIRWLAELADLPPGAGGLLVSGGSLATVTALAAARQAHAPFDARAEGLAGQPPLTVYAAARPHSCVAKAVELLGIGRRNLRPLASPAGGSTPGSWIASSPRRAQRDERPVAVVASAGTASTGAIDPLARDRRRLRPPPGVAPRRRRPTARRPSSPTATGPGSPGCGTPIA